MKCPHCGGEHPASYKFCPVTGKEIDAHHGMKALIVSDDKRKALCKAVDTLLKIKFGNREV